MNVILKCAMVAGLVLLAETALADGPGKIQVCLNATHNQSSDYYPQQYTLKLTNGSSQGVTLELPSPTAYQGWGGMSSKSMPDTLTVTSDTTGSVQCDLKEIPSGSYVSVVVDYGTGTVPLSCAITASPTTSTCQGNK